MFTYVIIGITSMWTDVAFSLCCLHRVLNDRLDWIYNSVVHWAYACVRMWVFFLIQWLFCVCVCAHISITLHIQLHNVFNRILHALWLNGYAIITIFHGMLGAYTILTQRYEIRKCKNTDAKKKQCRSFTSSIISIDILWARLLYNFFRILFDHFFFLMFLLIQFLALS